MKKHLLIILSIILLICVAAGCSVNTLNNETDVTVSNTVSEESETHSKAETEAKSKVKTESKPTTAKTSKKKKTAKEKTKASSTSKAKKAKKAEKTLKAKKTTKAKTTKQKTTKKIKSTTVKKAENKSKTQAQTQNICYLTIDCSTINSKPDSLKEGHESFVPENGIILGKTECEFKDGDTVFDILERACKNNNIKLSSRDTIYGIYVSGINNLDEFDCGSASGWVYTVNSKSPPKSCDKYTVSKGDEIVFKYVC